MPRPLAAVSYDFVDWAKNSSKRPDDSPSKFMVCFNGRTSHERVLLLELGWRANDVNASKSIRLCLHWQRCRACANSRSMYRTKETNPSCIGMSVEYAIVVKMQRLELSSLSWPSPRRCAFVTSKLDLHDFGRPRYAETAGQNYAINRLP
jgi:hypothetical protein